MNDDGPQQAAPTPVEGERSEAYFRNLAMLSSDWFWEQDAEHRYTRFDHLRPDQARVAQTHLGLPPWETACLNMSEADWSAHRTLLERRQAFRNLELERKHPQGGTYWISLSGTPMFSASGEFQGYCGVGRDITARKKTQQTIESQLGFIRYLTNQLPGMVWQLHLSAQGWFSCPFASEGVHELFALAPDDIRDDAAPMFRRIVPEDFRRLRAAMRGSAQSLSNWSGEYRVLLPDGRTVWHASEAIAQRQADGSVVWYGFTSDISDRIAAKETLQSAHQAVKERSELIEAILSSASQGVICLDASETVIYYNQRYLDLLELPESLLEQRPSLSELVAFQHRQGHLGDHPLDEAMRRARNSYPDNDEQFQYVRRTRNGRVLDIKTRRMTTGGWVRTFTDVTEYLDVQGALRLSEARLRTLFEAVPARLWFKDNNGRLVVANQELARAYGLPLEQILGRTVGELFPQASRLDEFAPDHEATDRLAMNSMEPVHVERELPLFPDGPKGTFEIVKRAVRDDTGHTLGVLGIAHDITERKNSQLRIEQLAFYDSLTGLCNRRLFLDRLHAAQAASVRHGHWGAVCFIDLDNFKDLNDTLGHDKGDALLVQVGQRLRDVVREADTVARLGGDEFVVLLEDLGHTEEAAALGANQASQKVLSALNRPYDLEGRIHHCTPSIGVTLFRDHDRRVEDVLQRADLAMYQSKSAGRNTVRFFDPHMQEVVLARAALERDLRQALDENGFVLHYQPVVHASGRTLGHEALLRWNHLERGWVSPADFIPVAEQTGLILPLGDWVLRTACAQLARWAGQPEQRDWVLAVNLSARQLRQADFVPSLLQMLEDTGARADRLKLELTESLLLHDTEDTIVKMEQLSRQGIRFALDDFGTGYSSLSYLKRLPLTQLKIDKTFVRDLLTDHNDAAIARTILQLARSLDLDVVAEGVETEGQRDCLLNMGCKAFQGYLFGRPGPL